MATNSSRTMTDHEEIRRWAEARDAHPACVRGTGGKGDTGMIRLDFPGYSGARKLQEISWDDWFQSFDDNNLALVVQDRTARGQQSNFNKLVGRETARARARGESNASRRGSRSTRKTASGRKKAASTRGARRSSRSGKSSRSSRSGSSARSGRGKTKGRSRSGTRSRSTGRSRSGSTRR